MESVTTFVEPRLDQHGRLIVSGFDLRYALTAILLAERRPMTVTELAHALGRRGLVPKGRPSHGISNAMRREIGKGRVVRVRRGVYRIDTIPKVTRWRIRRHAAQLQAIASPILERPSLASPSPASPILERPLPSHHGRAA